MQEKIIKEDEWKFAVEHFRVRLHGAKDLMLQQSDKKETVMDNLSHAMAKTLFPWATEQGQKYKEFYEKEGLLTEAEAIFFNAYRKLADIDQLWALDKALFYRNELFSSEKGLMKMGEAVALRFITDVSNISDPEKRCELLSRFMETASSDTGVQSYDFCTKKYIDEIRDLYHEKPERAIAHSIKFYERSYESKWNDQTWKLCIENIANLGSGPINKIP